MSDFTTTEPNSTDQNYFEFDPGADAATKAGDRNFAVPEGWYPMAVSKFEKTASKAGNPMFVLEFTDTAGTTKSRYPYKMYQVISEKSKPIIGKLLGSLGCERNVTGSYKVDPSKFLGTTVDVFLKPETYEGTTRSKPAYIRAAQAPSQAGVF